MDRIQLNQNESLVVIVRHPNHTNNEIPPDQAERVRMQGHRLRDSGISPHQIIYAVASNRKRSQTTANLLLEGLDAGCPMIVSSAYDALDEIGSAVKDFKAEAKNRDSQPWEMLAEHKGQELCIKFGITDRLVRATQFWTICTTTAQLVGHCQVAIVSGHNGNGIEPAIELAKCLANGKQICNADQLPDPSRYVQEAGVVLLYINTTTGLLTRDPVYLDAEASE